MTKSEMQSRIRLLRDELESRHKYGTVKLSSLDGNPIAVEKLQTELYSLIFKLSRLNRL